MLGVTNLLTPLSYANAADVGNYDTAGNPIWTGRSFSFIMPAHDVFLYAITEANTYTVDYEGHWETSWTMSGKVFTYDSGDNLDLNAFNKTWYTFTKWTTEEDGGGSGFTNGQEVLNLTSVDNAHVPIYAQWWANTYSIDYDLNDDGSTSKASHPKTPTWLSYDETWTIENPTRTWYTFTGWYVTGMDSELHLVAWEEVSTETANAGTGTQFKNLRATSWTVHLAARWKADEVNYTINHFLQELDGNYPVNPSFTNTGTWTADTDMTWATNTYTWFTTPSEYSQNIEPDGTTTFRYNYERKSYDLTLIAGRWVDTVTVDSTSYSSGGTNSGTKTYSFKFGDQVALHFALKPWYQTGVWSGYEDGEDLFNMPAENISKTAYADVITYTITQDCQWGSGCVESQEYNVESAPIPLPTPTGTNSDFLWWTGTNIEGTVPTYTIPTGSTWNKEYTAQWKCHTWYHASNSTNTGDISYGDCIANTDTTYTIHYERENLSWGYSNYKDGTGVGTTNESTNGRNYANEEEWFTVSSVTTWTIAWDGSTDIIIKYDRNNYHETIIDGTGITTTAVWAYDSNADGSGQHQYGDTVTLSQTTKSGYTFDHWEVKDASWNEVTLNGNTFTMPASDVTIRSYSTTNPYNLTINKNWGTGGSDDRTYTVEDTVPLVAPSRDHSIFVWWSWTDLTEVTHDVSFSGRAYDSSYEAVWDCVTWYTESDDRQKCVANEYTVTIDYDDDDLNPDTVKTGFTYDQTWHIANPSKSWYDFAWWTVSWADSTATVDGQPLGEGPTSGTEFKNLTTTSGGNVTLTATWTPKTTTEYKVFHYTKNLGSGYTLVDSGTFNWTSDAHLTVANLAEEFTGFGAGVGYTGWTENGPAWTSVTTVTIDRHGTTEIHIYYDRSMYHVYLSGDANVLSLSGAGDYRFWDTVNVSAVVKSWYHFKEWQKRWSGFVVSTPSTPEP